MLSPVPPPLLPDDPEEILRLYRDLPASVKVGEASLTRVELGGAMRGVEIGLFAALLLLVVVPNFGGETAVLVGLGYVLFGNALANLPIPNRRPILVPGLLSGSVRLGENLRAAAAESVTPPDPYSLDVIEPVARALAQPVLLHSAAMRANLAKESPGLPALIARLGELDAQESAETDPAWREAVAERRIRIADEVEKRRAADAASLRLAAKLKAEADALESALERLSLRRKLLNEIAADRRAEILSMGDDPAPNPVKAARRETAALRERLATLTGSLAEGDALATARLGAEREMARWERVA